MGNHQNKRLQTAWDSHGESAFEFEILEQSEDDLNRLA
jgi:hypothetical protein